MSKKRQPIRRPVIPPKRGRKPKSVAPVIPANLTGKQQRFIEEYLVDLNATQAAIRAGYSAKTAYSSGQRLLKNVEISKIVNVAIAKRSERTEVTADRVVRELARVGFSDLSGAMQDGRLLLIEDMGDEVRPAIASIKVVTKSKGEGEIEYVAEVRAWDKVSALRALMPHVGLTTEKTELKGSLSVGLQAEVEAERARAYAMDPEQLRKEVALDQEYRTRLDEIRAAAKKGTGV